MSLLPVSKTEKTALLRDVHIALTLEISTFATPKSCDRGRLNRDRPRLVPTMANYEQRGHQKNHNADTTIPIDIK